MIIIWLLLSLPTPASPACFLGKAADCQEADYVPGSDLAGEGYGITKMQRLGTFVIDMSKWELENNTCNLCKNPFMQGKKQKLPKSVVDWRPGQKCKFSLSSSVFESSESLVSSSVSSVENNWKVGLGIGNFVAKASVMLAGTNSRLADYSMAKTKKDKFSFIKQSVSCKYYSYRLSSMISVHPELNHEFTNLPEIYDNQTKESYLSLVEKFGTHYITKVKLGGSVGSVTSVKECMASLQDLSTDEVKTCLDVEASASVRNIKVDTAYRHCKQAKDKKLNKDTFAHSFSDRLCEITGGHTEDPTLLFSSQNDPGAYKQWLSSVPEKPDVISFSLKPLHKLLPVKNPKQKQLRRAIRDYILQRALLRNCSTPCKTGVATNPKEPCACTCHNNPAVRANCCPAQLGSAQVTVTAVRATGLWGDNFSSKTDGYVKVLRNRRITLGQTGVIWNQNSPVWKWPFNLGDNILSKIGVLTLEVWDRDSGWDDDLLGACNIQLKSGTKTEFCKLNHGLLYYKTEVTCAPGLSGSFCSKYSGVPMSSPLEKIYASRHAQPLPKDLLLKMGVLLDERRISLSQNQKSVHPIFEVTKEKRKMYENLK